MEFKHPSLLLLLIPLVGLVFKTYWDMSMKRKYAPRIAVPWKRLWGVGSGLKNFSPRFWHILGYSIAAAFFVVALARPQLSHNKIKRNVEGIDIMVVLDTSASMRVEDFGNQNRINTAKQILKEFILGRNSDKIGLAVFSGESVTMIPPTLDYPLLLDALKSVQIGDLKDGTAIGDALATAVARFKESRAKSRIMILVTDGDSNIGQVDPLTGGDLAKGYGVRVYSVAIGTEGRVRMPFIRKDIFGRKIKTYQYFDNSINPDLLQKISKNTGGKFYRVHSDVNVLREVFSDIDKLERRKIETKEQVKYDEKFKQILVIGLIVFMMTFLLQQTFLRVYP